MMQAVVMNGTGGVDQLQHREVERPKLESATAVEVAIAAAGINPIDTKIRQRGLFFGASPPAILGCDGAGEVIAVGSEVSEWQIGDRVWFCHGGLGGTEQGNYAQYSIIEQHRLARLPEGVTMTTAAAAPLVAITAWEALFDQAQLQAGETVLIHGGAGGVGHVAIQLAKQHGAIVWTTVGNDAKQELVTRLGADRVFRYDQGDFVNEIASASSNRGVDVVLEMHGGTMFERSQQVLAYRGRLVTLLDPGTVSWAQARNRNARISFELMLTPMVQQDRVALLHQRDILRQCGELIRAGKLHIEIAGIGTLADIATMHSNLESGHSTGKWVVTT